MDAQHPIDRRRRRRRAVRVLRVRPGQLYHDLDVRRIGFRAGEWLIRAERRFRTHPSGFGEPLGDPSIQAAIEVADGPAFPGGGLRLPVGREPPRRRHPDRSREQPLVVVKVPVGIQPGQMAAAYGSVWVPNYGQSTISRIDPATDTATAIETAAGPGVRSARCGRGSLLWIGNCDAGTPGRHQFDDLELERTLNVAGSRSGNRRQLWVAGDDGFARVDPKTGKTLMTIDLGPEQPASAASFDGERLWVSYREGFGGAVAWIDLATAGRTRSARSVRSPDAGRRRHRVRSSTASRLARSRSWRFPPTS